MGATALKSDSYSGARQWVGKDRLSEFISDPEAYKKPGFYGRVLHLQGNNLRIQVHGDEATATACSVVLHSEGCGPTRILGAGANRWGFVGENGSWRIQSRLRRGIRSEDFGLALLGEVGPSRRENRSTRNRASRAAFYVPSR
jgi:hypothetical protein